jgi:uncharacterized protein (DUF983 family)
MFRMDHAQALVMWVMSGLWLPLATVLTSGLPPPLEGVVVGFARADGVTREAAGR